MQQTAFHIYDQAHHKGTIIVTVQPGAFRERVTLTIAMIDQEWEHEMAALLRPLRQGLTLEGVRATLGSTRYHIVEQEQDLGEKDPA